MEEITVSEIEKRVVTISRRRNKIQALLKRRKNKPSIVERVDLQEEESRLYYDLLLLRKSCPHPITDGSTGGGTFCSICDKILSYS